MKNDFRPCYESSGTWKHLPLMVRSNERNLFGMTNTIYRDHLRSTTVGNPSIEVGTSTTLTDALMRTPIHPLFQLSATITQTCSSYIKNNEKPRNHHTI